MTDSMEWLEVDGLGGFASGTIDGIRTRRYHGLLRVSPRPPAGRYLLVNGFDAWVETAAGAFPLSSQLYLPEVIHPDARGHIQSFESEPWPGWTFLLPDGTEVVHEIFAVWEQKRPAWPWLGLEGLDVPPCVGMNDFRKIHLGGKRERAGRRLDPCVEAVDQQVTAGRRSRGDQQQPMIAPGADAIDCARCEPAQAVDFEPFHRVSHRGWGRPTEVSGVLYKSDCNVLV